MRIYLFPENISLDAGLGHSPILSNYLRQIVVNLEIYNWNGKIESIPEKPAIIRASIRMSCDWAELGKKCQELGHFAFSDDKVVLPDGNLSHERLISELEKFLYKNRIGNN